MRFIKYPAMAAAMFAAATAIAAAEVTITIDAARPGPVINKNIYGQFAEHLGAGIYGGIWVGPESAIPNTRGWRKDVVGALKNLQVPLLRWPGGCFADEYHWRDGIGPRGGRPARVNSTWGGAADSNAVGTHEFFDLVELLGAEAYVNGNLRTGSPQEVVDWIDYMTADAKSAPGQLRAKNGHPKPFKVGYFGIGNEAWGCGGYMDPARYTKLYNEYQAAIKARGATAPQLIASGGKDFDLTWTEHLSKHAQGDPAGITVHYYTTATGNWEKKGQATGFGEDQWFSTLQETLKMQGIVTSNLARLDENDPARKFKLILDEWGSWYDPAPGANAPFLQQQNSLRDAVLAALNLHIFHAHADRISMTNIAQMVNVLQAMILTEQDRMVLTPTYHAFKMYVPFQDATSLPFKLDNNPQYTLGKASIPTVSASAARGKDGTLYLALVNTNPREPADVAVSVAGAKASSASGAVLTAAAIDAHNTFAAPGVVAPAPFAAAADAGKLVLKLPAKSIVVVAVK